MNDRKAVEARVLSFIKDYADWENDCLKKQMLDGGPDCPCEIIDFSDPEGSIEAFRDKSTRQFDDARITLEEVCRKHCTKHDLLTRSSVGYGTPLKHDPEVEHIEEIILRDGEAVVETASIDGRYSGFEYTLVVLKGEWRIAKIQDFLTTDEVPGVQDWSNLPDRNEFSVFDDADIDFQEAFRAKGEVRVVDLDKPAKLSLCRIGEVELASGYLAVVDPGNLFDKVRPLEVRLNKGKYPVELVRAGGINAFVRIAFGDAGNVTAFVPARWIGEADDSKPASVGTRGGYIFVVDASVWAGLPERDIERFSYGLYEESAGRVKDGKLKILKSDHSGVLIERGGGDYSCPMYWGINDAGAPQALIVDLAQCGAFDAQSLEVQASERLVEASQVIMPLTEFGIHVRFRREGDQIAVLYRADGGIVVDVIDGNKRVVTSTERSGVHTSEGDERIQYIPFAPERLDGFRFRFRWHSWRHAFARSLSIE